jgi:hypothetical protein
MQPDQRKDRRDFLNRLAKIFLGALGAGTVTATVARRAEARVFAALFLKEKPPLSLPEGYYDDKSQLFLDARSRSPMFVDGAGGPKAQLSDDELNELLKSGRWVDTRDLPKMKIAGTTTLRSLYTTSCCPIVTDSTPDTVED